LRIERERWLAIRDEQVGAARRLDADTLVTVSHACQREWCDISDRTLIVRNYISLVADSIGCARNYESDSLGRLKRSGDADTLVESTRAAWTSNGLSEEQAKAIASKYSWSTKAPRTSSP
jgi:hypothetical protein